MADSLPAVADRFRAQVLAGDRQAAGELVRAYGQTYEVLQQQMAALLAKMQAAEVMDQPVRLSWLYEQQRLAQLQQQALALFAGFAERADATIVAQQQAAFALGEQSAQELLAAAFSTTPSGAIAATFNRLPSGALRELMGTLQDGSPLRDLLATFGEAAAADLQRALVTGVATGQSPQQIAYALRQALGGSLTRALTISRTESLRSYRTAALETYRANDDVVKGWVWLASLSSRTCAYCISMNGSFHKLEEPFASHPRCLTPGAVVTGARVLATTARRYDGEVVDIVTAAGHELTVTPNHPVLTPEGWVAASLLHEGDDVVSSRNPERVSALVDPDHYQRPALVEDVARACGGAARVAARAVPVAPEDFHGDGLGSEVCVVRTDGLLRERLDAALAQPQAEQFLCRRHVRAVQFAALGDAALDVERERLAADGGVGRFGVALALLGRAGGLEQPVGFDGATDRHARIEQSPAHRRTGRAEGFGDGFLGRAGDVARDDLGVGQGASVACARLGSDDRQELGFGAPQTALLEDATQAAGAGVVARGGSLAALAGHVIADRILQVRRRRWRGHVYNLETATGWYIANGIVTHNCRCTNAPITKTYEELGIKTTAKETRVEVPDGATWFAQQPEATQRAVLGPAKYAAYRDGQIALADLRGFRTDPRWGPVGYERSLQDALASAQARGGKVPVLPSPAAAPRVPKAVPRREALARLGTGKAAPGERLPQRTPQSILDTEKAIRSNATESAYVFDRGGSLRFTTRGETARVGFTRSQVGQLRDAIVTHNHPGPDLSLSVEDVKTAATYRAREIRAVTSKAVYSLQAPAAGWDARYWTEVLQPSLDKHIAAVSAELRQTVYTAAERRQVINHEVWTRVSQETGLAYRRETLPRA